MRKTKIILGFVFVLSCLFVMTNSTQAISQSDWSQINTDGFGDAGNIEPYDMIIFNDELYVSVTNNSGVEIQKYDGTSWSQVNVDGFGSATNRHAYTMAVYNNELYAGTSMAAGRVYKYSGNGTNWNQVNIDGFGNANNTGVTCLFTYDNNLYAGTWNGAAGAEVWRYSGSGTNWTQIVNGGVNDVNNSYFIGASEYNGKIYLGTSNANTGTEVFRYNGTNWTQVNSDGFDGAVDNRIAFTSTVYNNELYFGTLNNNGAEVWKYDGISWTKVANGGLGDSDADYALSLKTAHNGIYLGLGGPAASKAKVYFYNGSTWEQINNDGFNDSLNFYALSLELFRGNLYAATAHNTGAEVWVVQTDETNPVISSQSPIDGENDANSNTNISFGVDDENSGVNADSLNVTVDGNNAIVSGVCQVGYSCTVDEVEDGNLGYDITVNPNNDFRNKDSIDISVNISDYAGNAISSSWTFIVGHTISPIILTTSGPGEPTRLQAYSKGNMDGANSLLANDITGLFPDSYTGGAGIVPIDQSNNDVLDQFLIFAISNGGPQARVMGLRSDGSTVLKGQQFVFQNPSDASNTSSIRDGLSSTVGDFDNDGFQDDAAFCLTGDYEPHVKIYTDVTGIDNWNLLNQFTVPNIGPTGCNLGTFQYDNGAPELLITPNHGPATPNVYIYSVGGKEKAVFQAYDDPINQGLTATGIEDRIFTTPNNGSSQVNAFNAAGERKNFWWVYQEHVRGDFTIRSAQLDPSDTKQELLISPIGSNGPHILGYRASGVQKASPNFFAFDDPSLRNGVGIATIENWHGVN